MNTCLTEFVKRKCVHCRSEYKEKKELREDFPLAVFNKTGLRQ